MARRSIISRPGPTPARRSNHVRHDRRVRLRGLRSLCPAFRGGTRRHCAHRETAGTARQEAGPPAGGRDHGDRLARRGHRRLALADRPDLGIFETGFGRLQIGGAQAMTTAMLILYTVGCYLLFKHRIIKPRPFPIAIAIAIGGLAVGTIVAIWMLVAPMSGQVVTQQFVVQLVPYVKGQVLKIHAQPGVPLKRGDLLLEIDPAPSQFTVNQNEAQLNAAKETVNQARAALQAASASVV